MDVYTITYISTRLFTYAIPFHMCVIDACSHAFISAKYIRTVSIEVHVASDEQMESLSLLKQKSKTLVGSHFSKPRMSGYQKATYRCWIAFVD